MRLCTKCRLMVNNDVLFCPKDGQPTVDASAEPGSGERRPSVAITEPVKFAIGQVLCGLGGVLLIIYGVGEALSFFSYEERDMILEPYDNTLLWTDYILWTHYTLLWTIRIHGILAMAAGVGSLMGAIAARYHFWIPLGLMGLGARPVLCLSSSISLGRSGFL